MQQVEREDLRLVCFMHQKKQLLSVTTKARMKARSQKLLCWYAENLDLVFIVSDAKLF